MAIVPRVTYPWQHATGEQDDDRQHMYGGEEAGQLWARPPGGERGRGLVWDSPCPSVHCNPVRLAACAGWRCVRAVRCTGYLDVLLPPPGFTLWDLPQSKARVGRVQQH